MKLTKRKTKFAKKKYFQLTLYKQWEIFIRFTHAAEIKFDTHVLWSLSFKFVEKKNLYLSARVWKMNFFFSSRTSAGAGVKSGARLRAWLYMSKRERSYLHKCQTHLIQFLTFVFHFGFLWKEKKIRFSYSRTQTKIFVFYKLKADSSLHMCVKFYFSRACRTHEFPIVYKIVIKNVFYNIFFLWFTQNWRHFSTINKIFTQLSPTEFWCIF